MQAGEPLTDTKGLDLSPDITTNPAWQAEQTDRLLGFEILQRSLRACYHPMGSADLADKIGADKGWSFRILTSIQKNFHGKH